MKKRIWTYLKSKVIEIVIGIFLFFYPSFSDFRKALNESNMEVNFSSFVNYLPNLLAGGVLVFLFALLMKKINDRFEAIELTMLCGNHQLAYVAMKKLTFLTDNTVSTIDKQVMPYQEYLESEMKYVRTKIESAYGDKMKVNDIKKILKQLYGEHYRDN